MRGRNQLDAASGIALPQRGKHRISVHALRQELRQRAAPDRGAWLANLAHHRIDTLFVAALYPAVAEGMPHDDEDFPTERAWADALPARFTLRFASSGVRVYDVRPGAPLGLGRPARP